MNDSWIDLVLMRAAELRAAGVLSVGMGDCAVTFAPLPVEQPAGDIDKSDVVESSTDPLQDPASYPNGIVPGFKIERLNAED